MANRQIGLEEVDRVEELIFEHPDKKYIKVKFVGVALGYVALMLLSLFILLTDYVYAFVAAECVITVACAINLAIVPRACRYKGFALRQLDISYRSGVIFPTIVTIPYSKIQQVSIKQTPVSRLFGLYSVEVVNGAQAISSINIPGLTKDKATRVKTFVMEKLT